MNNRIRHLSRIDQFRAEVDFNLAMNDDLELDVTDNDGRHPVVVALSNELLSTLMRRIEMVGGYANVFVENSGVVQYIAVIDAGSAIFKDEADNMTGNEQPSQAASVGMFVEHLSNCPHGVKLPARLAGTELNPMARTPREVEFAEAL